MSVEIISGNIFTAKCQTIVNTINCVGVMGAGIALECRLRYPAMYNKYLQLCDANKIDIGLLWIYKATDRWVLNFPTKKHWRYPSKVEYLHAGLDKFMKTFQVKGIDSIAFPLLGSDRGGIPYEESLSIMKFYLDKAPIEIKIYKYNRKAKDDIYDMMKDWLLSQDINYISKSSKLRKDYVVRVIDAMQSPNIVQLNQLARVKGIGIKTLERLFWLSKTKIGKANCVMDQQKLF